MLVSFKIASMLMDRLLVKAHLQTDPSSLVRIPIFSISPYLKDFDKLLISNIQTGYVQCRICSKIVRFDRRSWRNVSYHSKLHSRYNIDRSNEQNIRAQPDCCMSQNFYSSDDDDDVKKFAKALTLMSCENVSRLRRVWNCDGKFLIKKVLFTRKADCGKEIFVTWKFHPKSSCWIRKAWKHTTYFPLMGI